MARKIFTTESFNTLISEIKAYITAAVSGKANTEHKHESFDELPEGIAKLSDFNMIDTVSGNLVVSENCVPTTPRQLSLYGKSVQGKTTGAQLLDLDTFENGIINRDTGKVISSNTSWRCHDYCECESETDYYISQSTDVFFQYTIGFYDDNKDFISIQVYNGHIGRGVGFTTPTDAAYMRISYSTNVGGSSVDRGNIMLNKGTEPLPWEPYTGGKASPNPEYPQEIDVAGSDGDVAVDVLGANFANTKELTTRTNNGVTFTPVYDAVGNLGYVEANGTNTSDSSYAIYSIPITKLEIGEKHTMSGCPVGGSTSTYMMQIAYFGNEFGNGTTAIVTEKTASVMNILVAKGYTVSNLRFYPMLNIGETVHPYEPYTEQSFVLSTPNGLPGIPVSSGGNYTDSDGQQYIADEIRLNADGTGKWVHRVGKYEGTSFTRTDSTGLLFCVTDSVPNIKKHVDSDVPAGALCNRYGAYSLNDARSMKYAISQMNYGIFIRNVNYSDIDMANADLASNPITVMYQLAEPYETDLSAEEVQAFLNLRMNKLYTTILNDEDCFMGVEYYVNNTENEVNQIIIEHITDHNDPHNVIPVIQEQINNLSVELTQAEYDALEATGETDPETVYYITDADPESGSGGSGASSADKVSYDNTESGLEATDLQGAMDEVTAEVDEIKQSFQDGCSTIAAAITSMGVSTANNASPATMAANVKKITNTDLGSATKAGAASSYTIPKSGKAIIFYTASFYNYAGDTHNGNSGSYTVKLGSTTLDSGSKGTPNSKDGFGFNGIWTGNVTKGQVVSLTTSTGGWIRATNVYMRIVIL